MSLRLSLDGGDGLFSPGGSAEPMRQRPPSPSPAIDFDAIDDANALKALLKAREEKMRTLEKRIEIAQGAKNKLKERYSEKIDMLEQLVVALRHKLQTQVDEVKKLGGKAADDADIDGLEPQQDQKIAALQKQNDGLKEMVQVQKQQLAAAKAQVRAGAEAGVGGDRAVLVKMEEKVHELTAALQARTRECKAQAQLLEQKEVKIIDLQTAIVAAENKSASTSPEVASGLSRKVQMLNSELEEARNMGTELQRQRDRFSSEFEALQKVVERQEHEKAQLQRESEERAARLSDLQQERQRQIAETEEMHRMLCELEDQRNLLAAQADDLKSEMSESMSRSLNASLTAERESKEVAKLQHETATLRKHLQATQQTAGAAENAQRRLQLAEERNAALERDLQQAQVDLAEARRAVENIGELSGKMQLVRAQAATQVLPTPYLCVCVCVCVCVRSLSLLSPLSSLLSPLSSLLSPLSSLLVPPSPLSPARSLSLLIF